MTDPSIRLRSAGALHEATVAVREASTKPAVLAAFADARARGTNIAVLGGRRSFGGQAFPRAGQLALDVGALDRGASVITEHDDGSLWIRAGGGTRFCDLHELFPGHRVRGTPTTDTITVAGALASCCHNMSGYFADSVRALTLLTPRGEQIACRADADGRAAELFLACAGSQGALGVVTDVELKLEPIDPSQQIVIESIHAGPARSGVYLDALEATRDDPRHDEGAGAVVYGVEGHAIVLGERLLAPGVRGPGARAPLTDEAHARNAFTQGLANRFPGVARRVISRTYREGQSCWSDWYGFAFFQRSYDLTDEVLRRRGPIYALARAIGVDPRLPILHQTWFCRRADLRELMRIYWQVMRRHPGVEARAEQQDLVLLPPCRWPLHSHGAGDEPLAVLTGSFAVRHRTAQAELTAAFLREFSREAHAAVGARVSLCKQIHCDDAVLRRMHAGWIDAVSRWRSELDPDAVIGSRFLARLGL